MTAEHNGLQLLASETFKEHELYRVTTFLNQCLKAKGLIFGLTRQGSDYCIRIYQGCPDSPSHDSQ